MSKFISNVNMYLDARGIRQNYVALMTGWDKSKVSKVLNGGMELKEIEAEHLAGALGHNLSYFVEGSEEEYRAEIPNEQVITLFAGSSIGEDDKKVADKLIEMFRFFDALTSVDF